MSMKVTRDEFVGVDRMGEDELRDLAHELLSENAKLRELVSLYHYGATHEASSSDALAWSGKVDSLRRELGIEVEDA